MKRLLILALCGSLTAPLVAEEAAQPQEVTKYLDQLQAKLEHTAQRNNQPNSAGSSVIGVRGTKQEPLSRQLYWKGKPGKETVSAEEIRVFRAGVEQARAGRKNEAISTLKSFEEKYPKSPLRVDAQKTIDILAVGPNNLPAATR